jgi:hypothetical protein
VLPNHLYNIGIFFKSILPGAMAGRRSSHQKNYGDHAIVC